MYRAYLSEDFSVYSNDCSLGNRKKRVLGHWRLFLLGLRRNCPAAGLLAVKSCEKCHESEATTIRFSAEKRQGVRDARFRALRKKKKKSDWPIWGSGDNQAESPKCGARVEWEVRSSFLLGTPLTSRSSFSDESSIIGKYDKRAAPPTKGIGTVKNLAELTLQIRTYLAIGGPDVR